MHQPSAGRVLRFEITERQSPTFDGLSFGAAGTYECLTGSAWCDLDPDHPLNANIANLAHAPRGADGRVAYRVDTCIIRPRDLDAGNGWLFYEIVNRGTKRALQRINGARMNNRPSSAEDVGTGFLMSEGFSIVWSGWQGDLVREPSRMVADLPVASHGGIPITATCREEFILDLKGTVREDINEPIRELSGEVFVAPLHYPAADLTTASLTVRARESDPRATPPSLAWRFLDSMHLEVTRAPGYDRGALYEFIYTARDPIVLGAGLASIRDIVSFLRFETEDAAGNPNPLLRRDGLPLPHAMGFGLSQSGRILREFLHLGMNQDSQHRRVFDGVVAFVTGSRRAVSALPFCQTTRYSRQHEDHLFPGDQFPFAYAGLHDPMSGRSGGILDRVKVAGVCPKVMHADTDSEIWSARASLCVTDCEGADIVQPDEVRVYLASGVPHLPFPLSNDLVALPSNTLSYDFLSRALVRAMREWIEFGIEPPASRFPSRAAGTLVPFEEARALFPAIPGCGYPVAPNLLRVRDHSTEPPIEGAAYPVFVTATDVDGNGIGGVRHPLVQAPVGTFLGWQLRREGYAPGALYGVFGGFVPFHATRAERQAAGDPRPSLEERYASREAWTRRIALAAAGLVRQRLLLPEDAARIENAARRSWDIFTVI